MQTEFWGDSAPMRVLRRYRDVLTADVNRKGVLDVDTVKGCSAGTATDVRGCYGACYAAATARFRGIVFDVAVVRRVYSNGHAAQIVKAVQAAPLGFFRVGTMGDPSHDWEHTTRIVEWLAAYAVPVIVTKHWMVATDAQVGRLVRCGAVLNTSVSALDTSAQLAHREQHLIRYAEAGGVSVARVVTCDFNPDHPKGAASRTTQARLLTYSAVIDNPLRIPRGHMLVTSGLVRVTSMRDLATVRPVSLARSHAYVGYCHACPDACGLVNCGKSHPRPRNPQSDLF